MKYPHHLHKTFSLTILIGLMATSFLGISRTPDANAQGDGSVTINNPTTNVTLAITPASSSVTVGQDFPLVAEVRAGSQSLDGAAAYLNFNPSYLQVVSITPGSTLPTILQNSYDNTAGQVNFAAGVFSSFPSGTFTLATITFHAVAPIDDTLITFNATDPRMSDVTFGGTSVLGSTTGGSVTINNPNVNPVPTLTALDPSSEIAGAPYFTLTATGTNFISSSEIRWDGMAHTTTYISATQLTAVIPAEDHMSPGIIPVTVVNPAPGGGTSNALNFSSICCYVIPTIATLSPSSAHPGGAAFTLTVTGDNFMGNAVVKWNGSARTTIYVSISQLTAAITTADIATEGSYPITVFNPVPGVPPGGATSNTVYFTVAVTGNPVPTLTSLKPASVTAGGGSFHPHGQRQPIRHRSDHPLE